MADLTVSRRTLLKGLGLALGTGTLPGLAQAGKRPDPKRPATRCYVYIDHSARNQWVLGALLAGDPARPRQILRRAKRHKLPPELRALPEVEARKASPEFKRYLYRLLTEEKGFRKGRGEGFEVYGIHADRTFLAGFGDRRGLVQLAMLVALVNACHLSRFREIFVYYDLPALKGVPRKLLRAALLKGVHRHRDARLELWAQRAVHRVAARDPGLRAADNGEAPAATALAAENLQITQFVVDAFFRKYEYGDGQWLRQIRRLVRRDIDAARLPLVRKGERT